jgi:hypothetical protein
MPGKGGLKQNGGKNPKKGKDDHVDPLPGPGAGPPLVITNEQLVDKNWWPVIGLVVENSPVESLLVDLMMDCVEGNNMIPIKKDDVLQETQNLLKIHTKFYSPDEALSRRELEKRAKKLAEEEQRREKERLEKEDHGMQPGERGKTKTVLKKLSKNSPTSAKKTQLEVPQGKDW